MPLLTTDRYNFFLIFFLADLSYVGFVPYQQAIIWVFSKKRPFFISYPKINPLRWIYFRRENKSKSPYDLFLLLLFFNKKKIRIGQLQAAAYN